MGRRRSDALRLHVGVGNREGMVMANECNVNVE